MTADEMVEKVAEAIARFPSQPHAQARAAIRAVHEAMREPTRSALSDGDTAYEAARLSLKIGADPMREAFRAVLAAHPIAEVARDA